MSKFWPVTLRITLNRWDLYTHIGWHKSDSIVAVQMACCMTALGLYLNQYQIVIREVWWQSPEGSNLLLKPAWKVLILKLIKTSQGKCFQARIIGCMYINHSVASKLIFLSSRYDTSTFVSVTRNFCTARSHSSLDGCSLVLKLQLLMHERSTAPSRTEWNISAFPVVYGSQITGFDRKHMFRIKKG